MMTQYFGGSTARTARRSSGRKLQFETLEARAMLAVSVVPSVETVADSGQEDDIAIWIHPTDTSLSRVIGTVKTSPNSLRVYNLQGQQVQSVAVPKVNNIDLRYNFMLDGEPIALLAGSNRSSRSIVLYKIDAATGMLQNVAARTIPTGMAVYGCAMHVSPVTGKHYVFVSSGSGQVQQWELRDNGAGKVDATQVRSFAVGSKVEGMVADDVLGHLYVGEESKGIWRYSAEPDVGNARTQVDRTGSAGRLSKDVEGLTIYYAADGTGYLIASSQGKSEFVVYERAANNAYVGTFKLVAGNGIDAVTDTDGIDITNVSLGPQFPHGMFVAQDNDDNFKLVRWDAIDAAFGGALIVDTTWDPRLVGAATAPTVDPSPPNDPNPNQDTDSPVVPDPGAGPNPEQPPANGPPGNKALLIQALTERRNRLSISIANLLDRTPQSDEPLESTDPTVPAEDDGSADPGPIDPVPESTIDPPPSQDGLRVNPLGAALKAREIAFARIGMLIR